MDAKLFKGFTALVNTASTSKVLDSGLFDDLSDFESVDPSGSQWRTMGFIEPATNEWSIDVQGAARLICVQINERNLPGAVLREEVLKRVMKYKDETVRDKISKKQIMEIKDDAVAALLPKAFIRRKIIPVMFFGDKVIVFTTSAKVCDDVVGLLVGAFNLNNHFQPVPLAMLVENNVDGTLTTLAKDGQSEAENELDDAISYLAITTVGTLKGPNKQTISVKDKDMASHDIQDLLKQEYTVVKLGLEYFTPDATVAEMGFTLNDKLVFSQFKIAEALSVRGRSAEDSADTFMATAYLVARGVYDLLDTTIAVMGGLRATAKPTVEEEAMGAHAKTAQPDDEDEL